MDDFESWTRSEISAAQAKILEMERALALFMAWRAKSNGSAPIKQAVYFEPPAKRRRSSRNDVIFEAFEAAGSSGLSQEEVQQIANENGLTQTPAALRALCWSAKQAGRLISLAPGRYAIAPKNEAAAENLSTGEAAAPTRQPHNQLREGDAGGGI